MGRKSIRAALFATFAGALIAGSPALATHSFQLRNCVRDSSTWKWNVYNADDGVEMVAYMTIKFDDANETKSGKCDGDGEGYCKVYNTNLGKQFHVASSATVYGDDSGLRDYAGLFDCTNEPAH